MNPIYVLYLFGCLALAQFLKLIYQAYFSPLSHIPGPFFARFTNLWYFNSVRKSQAHHDNVALHKQYAKPGENHARVVRLGPNLFSIAAPDKIVYGIGSKMPKSSWYEGWKHPSPDRWTMFPDQNIQRHAETRRKYQALYSLSSLLTYEKYVDQCGQLFIEKLTELSNGTGGENHPINLAHWLQCCAFDMIGLITYSKRFGFLEKGEDIGGVLKALDRAAVYGTLIGIYHQLHPIMYKIMEKIPSSGAAGRNYIMRFAGAQISQRERERREGGSRKMEDEAGVAARDFTDRLMDMRDGGEKGVNNYHIFMLSLSNIFAGSDTTASSLSGILYYLITSPDCLRKLRAEIKDMEEKTGVQRGQFGFKQTQEMPYLQACMKEGLRLHPPAGLPLWRVVPTGGAEICGTYFPGGSIVGINTWVSHRDEDVWGRDAAVFRPERWVEAEADGGEHLKTLNHFYMAVSMIFHSYFCSKLMPS
jgi:hypothetical protein